MRFEPLDRAPASFETQFQLTVAQGNPPVVKFSAVFGALGSLDLLSNPWRPVVGGGGVLRIAI